MDEQMATTPYDITKIPHFPISPLEFIIPILAGLALGYVLWLVVRSRFYKSKTSNIKIELESFISANNPTREDLALIVKKYRRTHGTALDEAESLLFHKDFDINKAKDIIRKLTTSNL